MYRTPLATAIAGSCLLALAGCNSQTPPEQSLNAPPPATDDFETRDRDLAQREAELRLQEREEELARREAELAEQQRAAAATPAPRPAPSRSTATSSTPRTPAPTASAAQASRVTIPSGTELTLQLSSGLSSKTAQPGDTFDARLYEDVMAEGKVALPAGSRVKGTVTSVISGSARIGGIPTLGLRFDEVVMPDGQTIAINGELIQEGKSDTGRDTAKILGGAAAGAVLGHQVKKDDKGKILGAAVGGAIGAIAAKKTGTEVELPGDSTLTIALAQPIDVAVK